MEVEMWVRMENVEIVHRVGLNETYRTSIQKKMAKITQLRWK
jgi:hypothetical protein